MYIDSLKIKRNKDAIKIIVYPAVLNVGYYRVFAPFIELAKNPEYDIRMSGMLSQQDDVDWADIIYFQRWCNANITKEAERARNAGKAVIYDSDDYLHDLPIHHPGKRHMESSRFLMDQDNLVKNYCNVMTVSTEFMKKLYQKKYTTKIEVLPNCIMIDDYSTPVKYKFKERIFIGWSGSITHFEDLSVVTPALIELMKKYNGLSLMTLNYSGIEVNPYRDAFSGIPLERRINIGRTEPNLVPSYLSLIDIGIAPLLINDFNRAKSNCKFLEYSMGGIPTVATDIEAYSSDGDSCILVENKEEQWFTALEHLILSKNSREAIGNKAKLWAMGRYDIRSNIGKWENVFKDVV